MADIRWTAEAQIWLEEIFNYIAQDNPRAAASVLEGIYQKAQILREHPRLGYLYGNERDGEIRILLYGHYRIAYLLKTDGPVDILGVFHGSLDIDRYLL